MTQSGFSASRASTSLVAVDAERFDPDQLADVDAGLVLRPGVAPDEFVGRVVRDRFYRALSDISRRPLDDPIRGGVWHSLSIGKAARSPAVAFGHKIDGCGQEASVALPVRC